MTLRTPAALAVQVGFWLALAGLGVLARVAPSYGVLGLHLTVERRARRLRQALHLSDGLPSGRG